MTIRNDIHLAGCDQNDLLTCRILLHLKDQCIPSVRLLIFACSIDAGNSLTIFQQSFNFRIISTDAGRMNRSNIIQTLVSAVGRTGHPDRIHDNRMMQFVRFQKTADGTYFAMIEPDYDVLPLIVPHFSDRFSEECWLIYDRRRRYGYYYAGHKSVRVTFEDGAEVFRLPDGRLSEAMRDEDEMWYQEMWRTYFKAICIKERLNPRKHRKDMPVRYWKYLTEKQIGEQEK